MSGVELILYDMSAVVATPAEKTQNMSAVELTLNDMAAEIAT